MKKVITIDGMHCKNCCNRVEKALKNLNVKKVTIVLEEKKAYVENDEEVANELLVNAVEDCGFDVVNIE